MTSHSTRPLFWFLHSCIDVVSLMMPSIRTGIRIYGRCYHSSAFPSSLITITEIDLIPLILLLPLVGALVLGDIDRSSVLFKRLIFGPVPIAFKYLFAWSASVMTLEG